MNSYWVAHAVSENHCETTKSLKIFYLLNIDQERVYHIKISKVNELKWRINSEWAALGHTVIECAVGAWHQGLCTSVQCCRRTFWAHTVLKMMWC